MKKRCFFLGGNVSGHADGIDTYSPPFVLPETFHFFLSHRSPTLLSPEIRKLCDVSLHLRHTFRFSLSFSVHQVCVCV